ncbi:hemolysin family protein [Millisia brevis]|uniref:hemolysin family protein n=1 Tax=Millisia brevis TaxID=264148 RepID=UPI00083103BE|nr:hemolysin family protein [Millisia brevis]
MSGDLFGALLTVVLLLANAFFVGAEFALISARRDRLEALVAQGRRRAQTVIEAGRHLSLMLAAAQLGITICSILLGRVGEPAVAHLLEVPFEAIGIPESLLHPISFAIALSLVVVLHILIGEMVPKNIALAGPERTGMILVPIHLVWLRIAKPLIWFYNWCANVLMRMLRIEPKDELDTAFSADEISAMIVESRSEGLIDEDEQRRLTQALETGDRNVADVLIPIDQMRSVPAGAAGPTLGSIEEAVAETGYSRYPVRNDHGALVGYLHVKDVLPLIADDDTGPEQVIPLTEVRTLPRVNVTMPLDTALTILRRRRSHLGEVVDTSQPGPPVTVGIVALEDVVEEFVGTVRDGMHRNGD